MDMLVHDILRHIMTYTRVLGLLNKELHHILRSIVIQGGHSYTSIRSIMNEYLFEYIVIHINDTFTDNDVNYITQSKNKNTKIIIVFYYRMSCHANLSLLNMYIIHVKMLPRLDNVVISSTKYVVLEFESFNTYLRKPITVYCNGFLYHIFRPTSEYVVLDIEHKKEYYIVSESITKYHKYESDLPNHGIIKEYDIPHNQTTKILPQVDRYTIRDCKGMSDDIHIAKVMYMNSRGVRVHAAVCDLNINKYVGIINKFWYVCDLHITIRYGSDYGSVFSMLTNIQGHLKLIQISLIYAESPDHMLLIRTYNVLKQITSYDKAIIKICPHTKDIITITIKGTHITLKNIDCVINHHLLNELAAILDPSIYTFDLDIKIRIYDDLIHDAINKYNPKTIAVTIDDINQSANLDMWSISVSKILISHLTSGENSYRCFYGNIERLIHLRTIQMNVQNITTLNIRNMNIHHLTLIITCEDTIEFDISLLPKSLFLLEVIFDYFSKNNYIKPTKLMEYIIANVPSHINISFNTRCMWFGNIIWPNDRLSYNRYITL